MSVLACNRRGCENIMCDRLILERTQYICDGCWAELLAFRETWPWEMSARDVYDAIVSFMDTRTGTHRMLDCDGITAEFERLTGGK